LNNIDLSHDGQCYRNSKYSPAQAEEYACAEAGQFFLFDEATNDFKASDGAFFVAEMVTDGDTHGAIKLFKAQEELLTKPYNITLPREPRQLPDIGHFIKTVSNGLYTLGNNNNALKGVSLLEPSRIRAISSDVSKHLRTYNNELVNHKHDEKEGSWKDEARHRCLKAIGSIVPHHAGNHVTCSPKYCEYLRIQRKKVCAYRTLHPEDICTDKEIIDKCMEELTTEYAGKARFGGKLLSVNKEGQKLISKVITSRVTVKNIDSLAKIMSSNRCKNYFSALVKYSHGKRLNLAQSNSWSVICVFAAALLSNKNLVTKIMSDLGIQESMVYRTGMARIQKKRLGDSLRQATEAYQARHLASKQRKLHTLMTNANSTSRHMTDKLYLDTESQEDKNKAPTRRASHTKAKSTTRRSPKCGNCGSVSHNRRNCPEPEYKKQQRKMRGDKNSIVETENIMALFGDRTNL
jgi:hypothetical protein